DEEDGTDRGACLRVDKVFEPSLDTVVNFIVPVSSGLFPRLKVLLPRLERLARGLSCSTEAPDDRFPPCDKPTYPSVFWPQRLQPRGGAKGEATAMAAAYLLEGKSNSSLGSVAEEAGWASRVSGSGEEE
ncbi:unnamed protein product, partial [Choristocarpus tenellus]